MEHVQYTFVKQERPVTGIMQNITLLSFVIRMIICCIVFSGILIFTPVSCQKSCLNHEMKSLLAFKTSLHDPTERLASWNVSLSCCHQEGISCDSRTGHVVAIVLSNCSLSGAFGLAALVELRSLQNLNVAFNNFTGQPIPQEPGLSKTLKSLNLSTVGFVSTVPGQIGNPSNLGLLDFSSSKALRSDDLSWLLNLKTFKHLHLHGMNMSATSDSW